MKQIRLTVDSVNQLEDVALKLLSEYPSSKVFALHGSMGAGKTTFVHALCKLLKVKNVVCSPTFTIINEYPDFEGNSIYHFDFYRLKNSREAFDIGASEYLLSGNYCFVEWPEMAGAILPEDTIHVTILHGDTHSQRVFLLGTEMVTPLDE